MRRNRQRLDRAAAQLRDHRRIAAQLAGRKRLDLDLALVAFLIPQGLDRPHVDRMLGRQIEPVLELELRRACRTIMRSLRTPPRH